jgi:hypothetical protein
MNPKLFAADTIASAVTSIGAPAAIGPGAARRCRPG